MNDSSFRSFFFVFVSLLIKEKIDSLCLLIHSASCNTQEEREREEEKRKETPYYSFSSARCCCCHDEMDGFVYFLSVHTLSSINVFGAWVTCDVELSLG